MSNNICSITEGPLEGEILNFSNGKKVVSLTTDNFGKVEALVEKTQLWKPRLFLWILELLIEIQNNNFSPKYIRAKAYYFRVFYMVWTFINKYVILLSNKVIYECPYLCKLLCISDRNSR